MKQNHIYQQIIFEISDAESQRHLGECPSCNTLNTKVNGTMALLDTEIEVPAGMADALLSKMKVLKAPRANKLSLSSYLQISVIIVAGIFLGFVLGKNANTSLLQTNKSRLNKSIIEYRNIHHFDIDYSVFQL